LPENIECLLQDSEAPLEAINALCKDIELLSAGNSLKARNMRLVFED
jgi:hypothetical protein